MIGNVLPKKRGMRLINNKYQQFMRFSAFTIHIIPYFKNLTTWKIQENFVGPPEQGTGRRRACHFAEVWWRRPSERSAAAAKRLSMTTEWCPPRRSRCAMGSRPGWRPRCRQHSAIRARTCRRTRAAGTWWLRPPQEVKDFTRPKEWNEAVFKSGTFLS